MCLYISDIVLHVCGGKRVWPLSIVCKRHISLKLISYIFSSSLFITISDLIIVTISKTKSEYYQL